MERKRIEKARGPGRPRSEAADRAILRAVIAVLRDAGYDGLAMDAVAARAGVGKATLYRRWKSKEVLVADAIEQVMRGLPVPDTGTLRGDLTKLLGGFVTLYDEPASIVMLSSLVAAMARSELIAERVRQGFLAARREALRSVFAAAVARGEVEDGAHLAVAMDAFSGALFYRRVVSGERADSRFNRALVELVAAGAGAPARPQKGAAR